VVAGERYGMGSSRDWAAKGVALLGTRAVLASSFERIHRSNLIGMGILPLRLPADRHPETLRLQPGDQIVIDADPGRISPRAPVPVTIRRASGVSETFIASAAIETGLEVEILRYGRLPDPTLESYLRERYGLAKAQLNAVLSRIAQEGWAERRPGYGWSFSPMLTTPKSLEQTYRVCLALEPAVLLEPTYHLDPETAARCREAELRLLGGVIKTDSADALHERGVRFHEAIIGASGNPFFLEAVRRINRVRRLLSYRPMIDRKRYQ
jgi:Aconitase A